MSSCCTDTHLAPLAELAALRLQASSQPPLRPLPLSHSTSSSYSALGFSESGMFEEGGRRRRIRLMLWYGSTRAVHAETRGPQPAPRHQGWVVPTLAVTCPALPLSRKRVDIQMPFAARDEEGVWPTSSFSSIAVLCRCFGVPLPTATQAGGRRHATTWVIDTRAHDAAGAADACAHLGSGCLTAKHLPSNCLG